MPHGSSGQLPSQGVGDRAQGCTTLQARTKRLVDAALSQELWQNAPHRAAVSDVQSSLRRLLVRKATQGSIQTSGTGTQVLPSWAVGAMRLVYCNRLVTVTGSLAPEG